MKMLARILVIPILFLSFGIVACEDDDDDVPAPTGEVYKATLTGASEVPPNDSDATGTATLTYNDDTKIFTLKITYSGMTVTTGHVHKAPVGQDGDPVFPFDPSPSPINYTSPALTAEQELDLRSGLYYVNLHSEAFPGGEIRGQLLPQSAY